MDDTNSAKKSSIPHRHRLVVKLVCSIALALIVTVSGRAEDKLSEEVEKAFEEFTNKAVRSKLEQANKEIEEAAAEIAERFELDEASEEKLAEHVPRIVEATQEEWKANFQKLLKPSIQKNLDPLKLLKEWDAKDFASSAHYDSAAPADAKLWVAALEAVLSPEQFATYKNDEDGKKKKLEEELEDYFIRCEETAISRMQPFMDVEIDQLKQLAGLDAQQLETLNAASKSAIDETTKEWTETWKKKVYRMNEAQRKQQTTGRSFPSIDLEGEQNPKEQQAWKDGIAKVLTEIEREKVEQRRADIRNDRAEALAMILIESLEEFIGFTTEQRSQLTEVLAKPLLQLPNHYYTPPGNNGYYSIEPSQMFTQIAGIVDTEVLPLLGEGQTKRWKDITAETFGTRNYSSAGGPVEGLDIPPAKEIDAIEAQRLVTAYIYLKAKGSTRLEELIMEAKVDGVARLGKLEAKQMALLRTAAKGAARERSKSTIANIESQAREYFKDVEPADLANRLKTPSDNNYYGRQPTAVDPAIWTDTVARVLNEGQLKAWQAESEASRRWQNESQVSIVMTEIDKIVLLEPDKRETLEGLVSDVLGDYQIELNNMFSYQWHIQGYYGLVPLNLLSNEKLGETLEKEQIKLLRSRNRGNFEGMLEQMKEGRKQRLKNEEKQKKK